MQKSSLIYSKDYACTLEEQNKIDSIPNTTKNLSLKRQ